jgi:Xaa-Pro aminopeptidase
MLTPEGCRARQNRFRKALADAHFAGALISDPRDVYYFTGLWVENRIFGLPSLLFLGVDRPSWLGTWKRDGVAVVDSREVYDHTLLSTFNPDNHRRLAPLAASGGARLGGEASRLGYQAESAPKFVLDAFLGAARAAEAVPIDDALSVLQRSKDSDEISCIRRAVKATLAAFECAREVIRPGACELEVLHECQRAAQAATGRPHYFGGDFRSGAEGGLARNRPIEAGEVYIIDAQSQVDGYWCALSRSFIVGGEPSPLQQSVYDHLAEILAEVPGLVRSGASCLEFWKEIDSRIREHAHLGECGLVHHGGHGIGLRPHEGPDINSLRDATFEVGNAFSVDPGAYSPRLRQGIRLENDFVLTDHGVEALSAGPMEFLPT